MNFQEMTEQLNKIEAKKEVWEPIAALEPSDQTVHPVVARCLELRELEIDVQGWTDDFSSTLEDQELTYLKSVLAGHSKDEDNHAVVLEYLSDYWQSKEVSEEAKELIQEWVELEMNPMIKKTFLEAGVFFSVLPMLTKFSQDTYTSRVSDWIMIDELRHVKVARLLIRYFSIKGSKSVLKLVEKTIRYLLQSEPIEVQDRWVKRSLKTAIDGKCNDFAEDSLRIVSGHFDQKSRKEVSAGYAY